MMVPGEYADGIRARLRAAAPAAVVHDSFLGPSALAGIFAATLLNVHPCLYDAYGMTIVEAASQGEAGSSCFMKKYMGCRYTKRKDDELQPTLTQTHVCALDQFGITLQPASSAAEVVMSLRTSPCGLACWSGFSAPWVQMGICAVQVHPRW